MSYRALYVGNPSSRTIKTHSAQALYFKRFCFANHISGAWVKTTMTLHLIFLLILRKVATNVPSLVPPALADGAASYWTTWSAQGYRYGAYRNLSLADYVHNSTRHAHEHLTEEAVFGRSNRTGLRHQNPPVIEPQFEPWASYLPQAQKDLFLLLDAGWADEHQGHHGGHVNTSCDNVCMNSTKFPFAMDANASPTARLTAFNAAAKKHGWRGGALWFGALGSLTKADAPHSIEQVASWSRDAGINYWKVLPLPTV